MFKKIFFILLTISWLPLLAQAQDKPAIADDLSVITREFSSADNLFKLKLTQTTTESYNVQIKTVPLTLEMVAYLPANKDVISGVYIYDILGSVKPSLFFKNKNNRVSLELAYQGEFVNKSVYFWDSYQKRWRALTTGKLVGSNILQAQPFMPYSAVAILADTTPAATKTETNLSFVSLRPLNIPANSESYLLIDETNQKVLAAKNIYDSYSIASLTKLMTAVTLLDNKINFNKVLTYNPARHYAYRNFLKLQKGEQVKVKDLFYSLLTGSVNVPARMLVDATVFSEKNFIKEMNKKAQRLNLQATEFTDTSGLDAGNTSSVYDLYWLFKQALKYPLIKDALATGSYEFDEVVSKDKRIHHSFLHTNSLVNEAGLDFDIIASKTGYTDEAQSCLLMQFAKQGKVYTLVTLGNPDYSRRFDEAKTIISYLPQIILAGK